MSGHTTTRESWLTQIGERVILPMIVAHGGKTAKFRVSVGWPRGARGGKSVEAIGQCWDPRHSSDGHYELFISPKLDAFGAIEVLVHELIHLAVGTAAGHKGAFKKVALAVGLQGKMTQTVAGDALTKRIREWIRVAPEYPHGPMKDVEGAAKEQKPGSRLIKASCEGCEYTVRLAQKWIDVAVPTCPNEDCDGFGEAMKVGD